MPYLKKPTKERVKQINREERQSIYQSQRWKALRLAKLAEQPLCELCLLIDKVTSSEDIHHIDSFMNYKGLQRIQKAYDFDNLLSVCKEHHSYLHKHGTTHGFNKEKIKQDLLELERNGKTNS